jgi:pyruvate dehydrogenase E1 component alpha subunit
LSDHTTADDASRYRNAADVKQAWELEPLLRLRNFLRAARHWDDAQETALLARCTAQVDAAVAEYTGKPKPATDAMFDHLFAASPPHLLEQRAMARRFSAKQSGH